MELVKELKSCKFDGLSGLPYVHSKEYEDNAGALELDHLPKMHFKTKWISVCYHHFRGHIQEAKVKVYIQLIQQPADFATKVLDQDLFVYHFTRFVENE